MLWDNVRNVRVTVLGRYFNRISGLCGTYSYDIEDDFFTSFNTITTNATLFGNSWRTDQSCGDVTEPEHPCDTHPGRRAMAKKNCSSLLMYPFSSCNSVVNATEYYVGDCEYDVCGCSTNPSVCLCEALDAYAAECNSSRANIVWKDKPGFELCCKCFTTHNIR